MIYSIHGRIFLSRFIFCIMEILILVLFYYLAQNPNFSSSIQPLMEKLKDSQQMLNFLKDLSSFTQAFGNFDPSAFTAKSDTQTNSESKAKTSDTPYEQGKNVHEQEEKNPQSPTTGIADEFIQNILDSYLSKAK